MAIYETLENSDAFFLFDLLSSVGTLFNEVIKKRNKAISQLLDLESKGDLVTNPFLLRLCQAAYQVFPTDWFGGKRRK